MKPKLYTIPTVDYKQVFAVVILLAVLCVSCEKKEPLTVGYYDIDSLLRQQINYLPKVKAVLTKEVRLENKLDATVLTSRDSTLWLAELDAFKQLADMNKPINRGAYKVEDGLQDVNSNLTIKSFTGSDKLTVEYLKLYYQGSISKIRKIEGFIQDENPLYRHGRKLTMEFQIIDNIPILTNYTIEGLQKMFLSDPVSFSITGQIKIK